MRSTAGENQGANWDLWNHYHIIRGLLAWYGQTGNETAFQTAQKAAGLSDLVFL